MMGMRCLGWICIASLLFLANAMQSQDFGELKKRLFESDALPVIYADPPTGDYDDFKNGVFIFQVDSIEIARLRKYRSELEPFILERIDSGFIWVYLAAFLKYESAIPKLKTNLLACDRFYGWEGPDYSKLKSWLEDAQYCYQLAYISAIEYIAGKPLAQAAPLSKQERSSLVARSRKCKKVNWDDLNVNCSGRWLLRKFRNGKG